MSGFLELEWVKITIGTLVGFGSAAGFVVALFIGFCVLLGFTKTKRTFGQWMVVKSLEESLSHQAVVYLSPSDPRGPADQLQAPELMEAARRKS